VRVRLPPPAPKYSLLFQELLPVHIFKPVRHQHCTQRNTVQLRTIEKISCFSYLRSTNSNGSDHGSFII